MSTDKEEFDVWWATDPDKDDTFWHDHNFPTATIAAIKDQCWRAWQAARAAKKEDELRPEYDLTKLKPVVWQQDLMYKHRGERLPRFLDLGQGVGMTRAAAFEDATQKAELWLAQTFKKPDEIESWEVKVRRAKAS